MTLDQWKALVSMKCLIKHRMGIEKHHDHWLLFSPMTCIYSNSGQIHKLYP